MSDYRRRARSPVGNPARMSAPVITSGLPTVNYGRSSDLHTGSLHAIPTRREHFVSPRSSGPSIETATHYKIKPERDTLAPPKEDRSRSRRRTLDSTSRPIIVTPSTAYDVVTAEPRSARDSREGLHSYREDAYVQAASSQHRHRDREYMYRGPRGQHTIDNADISGRHPHDRENFDERLLRVGSAREGQMYPRARHITDDTLKRHADTVKDDYGDDGYGYTNPRDLVEYDLEKTAPRGSQGPQRSRPRRESWDNSRGGRPDSISGYADIGRGYDRGEKERGPPPTTRGFDRIHSDRGGNTYNMPGAVHMPTAHDHISHSPLAQAPSYPSESLGVPERRTSTRRPVSVYNDDRDRDRRDRGREEHEIMDGRARRADAFNTLDDVQNRGFGIRPDLLAPSNVITVRAPAPTESPSLGRGERMEREEERLRPRERQEKRYHDGDGRQYHASEREPRRDDRDRSERRPDPTSDHDDRDRKIGAEIAAGSIAAAAMGVGATAVRESRHSDDERERDRRRRRDSNQYYDERPLRRHGTKEDEPPVVDLSGERTSPRDGRTARETRESEREYRDQRAHDSDSLRERDRDTDNRQREPAREPRRESPTQSEKVDLSDRYPVIERNVAKEDTHYPSDASRSSPPISRRDRDLEREQDSDTRGAPSSRRDRILEEAALGNDAMSSPITMNEKEARGLRALRGDMGLGRTIDNSPPSPRPAKEPLDASPPTVAFSRQPTDRIPDRPLDLPSRQLTAERSEERSFVPPSLRAETSAATAGTMSSQASHDSARASRPDYGDRGYSSTSTSSSSGSNIGRPRETSKERTRGAKPDNSLQVVSPGRSPSSSQAMLPMKGILKAPRVFPELPAEERPGVAPLIDKKTGKNWDGRQMADVPATARWTKISRKLVNPEALEKWKERYEVRDDFVVVLRVLTKEEIQGYAIITQAIRAEREDEERNEYRRRKGENAEVDDNRDDRRRHRDDDAQGGEDLEREERRRRQHDAEETEDERAARKRREREREERRRKHGDDETFREREERKTKEREGRHRRRDEETADQAEERRRREKAERSERHKRERRERHGGRDEEEEYEKERKERHRRHRERRERDKGREKERERENESDTTEDEKEDGRRRRRKERD